jgi:hypothetical protein
VVGPVEENEIAVDGQSAATARPMQEIVGDPHVWTVAGDQVRDQYAWAGVTHQDPPTQKIDG